MFRLTDRFGGYEGSSSCEGEEQVRSRRGEGVVSVEKVWVPLQKRRPGFGVGCPQDH